MCECNVFLDASPSEAVWPTVSHAHVHQDVLGETGPKLLYLWCFMGRRMPIIPLQAHVCLQQCTETYCTFVMVQPTLEHYLAQAHTVQR